MARYSDHEQAKEFKKIPERYSGICDEETGASLGRPDSLNGIKFYVTTWDLDGLSSSYRPLQAELGPWNFAGGSDQDALIWDDTPLLSLSE